MSLTTKPSPVHLRRELHIWEGIGLSVAGASPALAMAFSGPGVAALVGRAAALSFLFAAVTCIFIGYAFMMLARKYNSAGSVYGFVGASIGPRSGFFAGWGLLQRESWARTVALVVGFITLLSIPVGTALGVYTLWVLLPAQSDEEYQALALAA